MKNYNVEEIRRLAQHRWDAIFMALAPVLHKAIEQAGRHVACPVHGGCDGFRLFADFRETGGGICNTCGPKADGFAMLMWVNDWTFAETLAAVAGFLEAPHSIGAFQPITPQTYEGLFMGFERVIDRNSGKPRLALMLAIDGETRPLFGRDLKRMARHFVVGDRVQLTRLGYRTVKVADRQWVNVVWTAKKVAPPQAKAKLTDEERQLRLERAAARRQAIDALWRQTQAMDVTDDKATAIAAYWAHRGLDAKVDGRVVRYVDALSYFDNGHYVGRFPCLVCAVQDPLGRRITLHRTYLTREGFKADVPAPKKLMAVPDGLTVKGCAIRLAQTSGRVLAVAEGVETALSVMTATGLACWSVISAGGMRSFEPPAGVRFVHIFADKDRSGVGEEAANELLSRLKDKGIGARIYLPDLAIEEGAKGVDWNDVLQRGGRFPTFTWRGND